MPCPVGRRDEAIISQEGYRARLIEAGHEQLGGQPLQVNRGRFRMIAARKV
jgi:hypothetical protein